MVLAHGFGALKEGGPIRTAERFAAEGFAGLAFDYRYFGESGGEPRQLLDVKRQLEDWRAAIAFARTLDGVDGERIGLWGSSYSGGHVMALAADDGPSGRSSPRRPTWTASRPCSHSARWPTRV